MNIISIVQNEDAVYPSLNSLFRPSEKYPEYPFSETLTTENNVVYDMVRNGFRLLGLDADNYGTESWNPLGDYIVPGSNVLLKPNMVMHENVNGKGTDCLFTHPSVVAAVLDYVIIAQKGEGKVTIGDAPLQTCDFDNLCAKSGYGALIDYYGKKGLKIDLADFRNVKTSYDEGVFFDQEDEKTTGVVVQLDDKSAFSGLDENRIKNLRITNYDPKVLQKHHTADGKHEYNVARQVIEADVIINLPKPKTHGKTGITAALKNLIGINANKEFLPHHTLGSKEEGGDAYSKANRLLDIANELRDLKDELNHEKETELAKEVFDLYEKTLRRGKMLSGEKYWEGSWHGNDTLWRTIYDLNKILIYADKTGKMTDSPQRKVLSIGDMIVSGEKEGPLAPSPKKTGVIVMGENPLVFDRAVCSLMGFDQNRISSLSNEMIDEMAENIWGDGCRILSNRNDWNEKDYEDIRKVSLAFQPPRGWIENLGSTYRDSVYKELKNMNKPVYIFCAGEFGRYAYDDLVSHGIQVKAFVDNSRHLWGTEIVDGVECIAPSGADLSLPFVVAVGEKYENLITTQIKEMHGVVAGILN